MIIDCGTCAVAGLACDDCVVTVLLGHPTLATSDADHSVTVVADEHAAAIGVLADAGLVPRLQLVRRTRAS